MTDQNTKKSKSTGEKTRLRVKVLWPLLSVVDIIEVLRKRRPLTTKQKIVTFRRVLVVFDGGSRTYNDWHYGGSKEKNGLKAFRTKT